MKKVVLFIGGLNYGGMERVVFIANSLLKDKYDITIVTLYQTNADYKTDAKFYDLGISPREGNINKLFVALRRLFATIKMKKELSPDVVFSFGMYSNYMNALSKRNEKIIMGIRSYDWFDQPFTTQKLDKFIVKKFHSVNSVSKGIAEGAEFYWDIPIKKNRVIYNPYDVDFIKEKSDEEVDDYFFDEDYIHVLTVGRLAYQKAFYHLIKAVSILKNDNIKIRALIIGHGELENDLKQLRSEMGLENDVILLGGKENPYKYMRKSDIYVLSSINEGFPNAMVEAMAVGCPIVAADCKTGPREILSETYTDECRDVQFLEYGVIVPEMNDSRDFNANNIEKSDYMLAKGIQLMCTDEEKRQEYREKSSDRVRNFSYNKFREKIIAEIESVLEEQ